MSANYQEKVVKALGDTIKWKVLKIILDIMADEILQLYRQLARNSFLFNEKLLNIY